MELPEERSETWKEPESKTQRGRWRVQNDPPSLFIHACASKRCACAANSDSDRHIQSSKKFCSTMGQFGGEI